MKVKIDSKFLKGGENIHDGDNITFLNEGEEVEGQWGTRMQIDVKTPEGEEKALTLNNTSKANMIKAYGGDSEGWVGKEARVNVTKQMVGKEMKQVILLTAPNIDVEGNVIIQ